MRRRFVPPAQDLAVHSCHAGDLAFVVIVEDVDLSKVCSRVCGSEEGDVTRIVAVRETLVHSRRGIESARRGEWRGSPSGRRSGPMTFRLGCGGNGGK
jgi:hypothetical protein